MLAVVLVFLVKRSAPANNVALITSERSALKMVSPSRFEVEVSAGSVESAGFECPRSTNSDAAADTAGVDELVYPNGATISVRIRPEGYVKSTKGEPVLWLPSVLPTAKTLYAALKRLELIPMLLRVPTI